MWTALSKCVKRESEVVISVLKKRYDEIKYEKGSLSKYINKFHEILRLLKEASVTKEVKEISRKLLSSLPLSYKPVADILWITKALDDFDSVVATLFDFDLEIKNSDPAETNVVAIVSCIANVNSAANSGNQNVNCYSNNVQYRNNNINNNNPGKRMRGVPKRIPNAL